MGNESKGITVREALERFKNGETAEDIAKELGVYRTTISRRMNNLGYRWDNAAKVWVWEHDRPQPLDEPIYKPRGKQKASAISKPKVNTQYIQRITTDTQRKEENHTVGLSHDDLTLIKDLLQEFKREKTERQGESLHDRIMSLSVQERKKRTMVLTDNSVKILDELAEKTRFNKSDLLEVAIQDLYTKYIRGT